MSGNAEGSSGLSFPTSLGTSTADQIRLLGQDLTADQIRLLGQDLTAGLMGKVSFGELAFWLVTPSETRVFEAVLVALAAGGAGRRAARRRVPVPGGHRGWRCSGWAPTRS